MDISVISTTNTTNTTNTTSNTTSTGLSYGNWYTMPTPITILAQS